MKKLLNAALATALMVGCGQALANEPKPISIKVNGAVVNLPDAKPFIDQATNRTMVPIRFVSEKLGAKVDWDGATQTVKITKAGKQIALRIGEKRATVSGKQITFDAAARLQNNRTFVPLRFISEAYGAKVDWLAAERLVSINTGTPSGKIITGKDFPVNEKDPIFQAFHQSLTIKDGMLIGKVPNTNLYVNFSVYFKEGHTPVADVLGPGESFSFKVEDIKAMGITIIDRGKKQELASYAYRSLPDLTVNSIKGGK